MSRRFGLRCAGLCAPQGGKNTGRRGRGKKGIEACGYTSTLDLQMGFFSMPVSKLRRFTKVVGWGFFAEEVTDLGQLRLLGYGFSGLVRGSREDQWVGLKTVWRGGLALD